MIIIAGISSALSSSLYNFTTKLLGSYNVKGEIVTITSIGGADTLSVIIGSILCT